MKIEVLFPEICNLYGDLANVRYLEESVEDTEIINTSLKDVPAFADENNKIDLIYMGTTTEKGISLAVEALTPYIPKLKKLIENGQFILLTGNALDVFGQYIDFDASMTGSSYRVNCLNILATHSEYKMMQRHNSFYIGDFNTDGESGIKVVGFKSLFGHTYADENDGDPTNTEYAQQGWFYTTKGFGRNMEEKAEGFRINNLHATYLTGPLLPLNPLLTNWLIGILMNDPNNDNYKAAHFEAAMDAYKDRLNDFSNEHFNPAY